MKVSNDLGGKTQIDASNEGQDTKDNFYFCMAGIALGWNHIDVWWQ